MKQEKMDSNERFVMIPNAFLTENTKKLTPDELYVYYVILQSEAKWFKETTKITINQIASEINLKKDKYQNRNKIKETLLSLKGKEVISFEDQEITNQSPLIIVYKTIDYYLELPSFMRGFEIIPFSVFEASRDSQAFYVLCLILKNKSEIAYSNFASLLHISDKSAKTLIKRMVDDGLITKQSGRYYYNDARQLRQEINQYEVISTPVSDTKKSYHVNENIEEPIEAEEKAYISTNNVEIDWGNWNKKTSGRKFANLTDNDLYLYYLQKDMDKEFGEFCEAKMKKLEDSGFNFSKMKAKAKERLLRSLNAEAELEKNILDSQEMVRIKRAMKKLGSRKKRNTGEDGFDVTAGWD
ncbi:hypothetical protein [Paenibacillus sp. FSL M7-0420]|uniref:hypothetical protein n=1 Tax=Paenibacillus sp. FSL M7-0420 TaxID=2921609 RepID=UPI0030F90AE4